MDLESLYNTSSNEIIYFEDDESWAQRFEKENYDYYGSDESLVTADSVSSNTLVLPYGGNPSSETPTCAKVRHPSRSAKQARWTTTTL